MSRTLFLLFTLVLSSCAYKFGLSDRSLPGGYTQVAIPVFKNKTPEVGIEPVFTNSLIRRFNRSQVARVTDKDSAPVVLEGTIMKVQTIANGQTTPSSTNNLPTDTVLTSNYRLIVSTHIVLRRKSDDRVIWEGDFSGEKSYNPPAVGTPVVNSADATYNQSARIEYISRIADDMMGEAHDRITENF